MDTSMDHVRANVDWWASREAGEARLARRAWGHDEPSWGIFGIPEREVRLLPERLEGVDAVELGCGTGYVSAWLARRGARPIGVDPTPTQLAIARRSQDEFGPRYPLVRAAGEQVPLRDGCCDLVISEYGAAIWADPHRWIPEAARLLRPGGELVFLGNSPLLVLCVPDDDQPATDRLLRPLFGMYRVEWDDDGTVEFHLSHGERIRLLRSCGFVVEDLVELQAPEGVESSYPFVTGEWANRWPAEEVWKARKA